MSNGPGSAVNVVVDGLAHLGPLSYLVPEGAQVRPGDAVEVPVGKRVSAGLVIGPGNTAKATRDIIKRYGERTTQTDLETAALVATEQATQLQQLIARMAPKSGKGSTPTLVGETFQPVQLPKFSNAHHQDAKQWLTLLHEPAVRSEDLAVSEAARFTDRGQVLILCPTTAMVERVLAKVSAGIVRLDSKAAKGEWAAFREGSAPVGVGTRAAAWYAPEKLAAIIVVDEQHPAHREQTTPRHHARDVAIARARAADVPLVLISRNPSPVAMGCGTQVHTVCPTDSSGWPEMVVHDETLDSTRSPDLPYEIIAELQEFAATGTGKPLVVVGGRSTRRCTGCFAQRRKPANTQDRCSECGDLSTKVLGYDKERIEEILGTQAEAVLPHELETHTDAGLVVITDVSVLLARPDLNPYHQAVDTVLAAAAAAGPAGKVVAVVRDATHPVLRILFEMKDQLGIAKRSYRTAQRLHLPPFGKLVQLQILQKTLPDMSGWPGHVHGPTPIKGGWEFVIRCPEESLDGVRREIGKLRRRKVKLRYHID